MPKYHISVGAIISVILFFIFQLTILQASIIFLASFIIDIDHYLLYVFKTKDFSIKNSINYFYERRKNWLKLNLNERKIRKRAVFVFHGIEFWILLAFLNYYFSFILFILIGIAIHMILDYIDIIYNKDSLYTKFSQLYVYFSNMKKI